MVIREGIAKVSGIHGGLAATTAFLAGRLSQPGRISRPTVMVFWGEVLKRSLGMDIMLDVQGNSMGSNPAFPVVFQYGWTRRVTPHSLNEHKVLFSDIEGCEQLRSLEITNNHNAHENAPRSVF